MEYEVGPKELIRKLKADDPDKLIIGHLNINSIRNFDAYVIL